jgi:lysophospholipase L1-like esterase
MMAIMRLLLPLLAALALASPAFGAPAHRRYLALGDSYTIGEGVADGDRWPMQLASALRKDGLDFDVQIVARTGWTVGELSHALDQSPPQGVYDLVTVLIGVNDQYRGGQPGPFATELRTFLGRALAWAGGHADHVVVVTIPDWGVTPFAAADGRDQAKVAREIDAFNRVVADETSRLGAHLIDITPASRRAAADTHLLTADGLHPSATQYSSWVKLIEPVARGVFAPNAH